MSASNQSPMNTAPLTIPDDEFADTATIINKSADDKIERSFVKRTKKVKKSENKSNLNVISTMLNSDKQTQKEDHDKTADQIRSQSNTDNQQVSETLDLFSDEQRKISSPEMALGEPYIHRWDIYG
jgi:hypothetical protein